MYQHLQIPFFKKNFVNLVQETFELKNKFLNTRERCRYTQDVVESRSSPMCKAGLALSLDI